MTKEMNILTTATQESKNGSSSKSNSAKGEVKSGPSLFDSMLQNANEEVKTKPSTQNSAPASTNNEAPANNNKSNQANTNSDTASKKEVSDTANKETSSQNVSDNTASKKQIKNDASETKTQSSEVKESVSSKQPSLLDKLMMEAQESINNEESATSKKSGNAISEEAKNISDVVKESKENAATQETTKVSDVVKEAVETKKEVISETQKENKTATTAQTSTENENKQTDNSTEKVVKPEAKQEGSLLDKLVAQANATISDEKTSEVKQDGAKTVATKEAELNTSAKTAQAVQTDTSTEESVTKAVSPEKSEKAASQTSKVVPEVVTAEKKSEVAQAQVKGAEEVKSSVEVKEPKNGNTEIDLTKKESKDASLNTDDKAVKTTSKEDNSTATLKTQGQSETPTAVKSEKVAQELAKLNSADETKLNVSKEALESTPDKKGESQAVKQESKSLLDKLVEDTKATIQKSEEKAATQNTQANNAVANTKNPTQSLLNNIYLTSQQSALNKASLENASNAKKLAADGSSVNDIKQSAQMLDLGLEKTEVIQEEIMKKTFKEDFLSKLNLSKDVLKYDLQKINDTIAQSSAASSANVINLADDVELSVPPSLVYNIQNRIVGAQQQMNSMMSDVARNMYLNYKPPVTAFRMNLNPSQLGSIAVLIKNEKDNGISISLNMSNASTLDSFVDNQGALRAALARNFNTETNINLDFNMQGDSSKQETSGNRDGQQRGQGQHHSTKDVLDSLSQKSQAEQENEPVNYM